MDRQFGGQMEDLRVKLIKMSSLVDEQVEMAIRSIEEEDHQLAAYVIERDNKVDKYDMKIEKTCQMLFALSQPVAMDLRFVMSALKINNNLERIGDISTNITKSFVDLGKKPEFYNRLHFSEISALAREMIKDAIDSFINSKSELAKKVLDADDKLDDLVDENVGLLTSIMKEKPENVFPGLQFFRIFQNLERLGDHSTNIAEEVYFIINGISIKHPRINKEEF